MPVATNLLDSLEWRCIGPFRGGRVVAVAGDPVDPLVFYFGACAGGVWKTTDGGTYWRNVSDGFFTTAAVGAIVFPVVSLRKRIRNRAERRRAAPQRPPLWRLAERRGA